MQKNYDNSLPYRDAEPVIPLETGVSFLTLITVAILGAAGILLIGWKMITPLAILLAAGLVLNLALTWLERQYGPSISWEWIARLSNMALITAGLHISWGLSSPYLPLYAVYIVTGAVRHGRRGAMQCFALSITSLLVLLALGRSLALEPLVRLAINVGLLVLVSTVAGSLGQRSIDATHSAERRAEELAVLNETGRTINTHTDVDRLLEEIRCQAERLLDTSNFCVALLDDDTGQLVFPLFYRNGQRTAPPSNQNDGLARYIVHTRKPLLMANMPEDATDLGLNYTGPPCLSWLGVPMIVGDKVLGVITVQSYERLNAFDNGHTEILQTTASHAAVALENARLYQETCQRVETFRVLAEVSRRLTRPTAPENILVQLPELLRPVIPFDTHVIYLYQAQPVERMCMVTVSELAPGERDMVEQTALERHPGWVVRNQRTLRVDDTHTDDRVHYVSPDPTRSILYAPLRYEDRCLGTIGLGRLGTLPFSEADEQLLQAVADQAAVAVENAQLYQELREQTEQLHHAYEELQSLDRRRTEFVQDVSHDLRAPLTFVKGYVELTLQGDLGPVTEQQRESLMIVLDKTSLLARLAEDVVRLEHPRLGPETLIPTSLPALARSALQGAEATANAARITLRAEIPDDIPQVSVDPRRLMQVLDNLLSNAIKYSPGGGTVTVSMENTGEAVQVGVQDEGIGIPKEAQSHIFERFYRVDHSRPQRFGSVGLGLAIVKEAVEAHGGKVWLESEIGQGSTFYFTVPRTPLAHPAR
ncbi:MAG: GAF domain-containing protein [Chloroflexota bacterium]|nr:GAF domain-containing protein [Chloroflexota bacterium]